MNAGRAVKTGDFAILPGRRIAHRMIARSLGLCAACGQGATYQPQLLALATTERRCNLEGCKILVDNQTRRDRVIA